MFRFKPNSSSSSSKEEEIQSNNNNSNSSKLLLLFHQMVKSHPNGISGIEQACKDFRQQKNNNKLLAEEEEINEINEEETIIPFAISNNKSNNLFEKMVKLHPMGIDGLEQDLMYWKEFMADIFTKQDVWITIFSFLGPGHYAFVGGVNKFFKNCYTQYFNNSLPVDKIPYVKKSGPWKLRKLYNRCGEPIVREHSYHVPCNPPTTIDEFVGLSNRVMKATTTDTFYCAVFSSVSCAKFWFNLLPRKEDRSREEDKLVDESICQLIALYGPLEVLTWAREEAEIQCYHWKEDTTKTIHDQYGFLRIRSSNASHKAQGFPWDRDTCVYASFRGGPIGLEILKYAYENGCPLDGRSLSAAAASGCTNTVRFVFHKLYPDGQPKFGWGGSHTKDTEDIFTKHPCVSAAQFGQEKVLTFLLDLKYELTENCFHAACQWGQLEMVKHLHEKGCPKDIYFAFKEACEFGYRHVVEFLYSINCYPQEERQQMHCMADASWGGHLDILKFLRSKHFAWDDFTCGQAVQNLEVLIWLRSQDPPCPWDEFTCHNAARFNRLDALRYAHENGCPWDEETCSYALGEYCEKRHVNSPECLRYAVKNFCPWNEHTHDEVMHVLGLKEHYSCYFGGGPQWIQTPIHAEDDEDDSSDDDSQMHHR